MTGPSIARGYAPSRSSTASPLLTPIRPWWLNVQVCDLAVYDEHGITLGVHPEPALTEVLVQAKSMRELTEPVREHTDFPCRTVLTSPCCQDHGIIYRHAHDLINSLGLHSVCVVHKAGQMLFRAGTCEGTGDRKEHNAFAGEEIRGRDRARCPAFIKEIGRAS